MKISKVFIFLFVFFLYKKNTFVFCDNHYGEIAATTALQTVVKDPISLTIKDLYDNAVKNPIVKLINKIKKVVRYRKVLRWSRIWWILLVREIVGDNSIEKRTEKELREIWDQCTIAVYNNTLNTVETKPLLFLHGILNECRNNFSTKLRQDPSLIVGKLDQIIKSEIYRFWVSEPYLKIGRSGILYTHVTPKLVPKLPKEYTLKYLSSYMVNKLKSLESKKNIETGKFEIDVESEEGTKKEADENENEVDETAVSDDEDRTSEGETTAGETNEENNEELYDEDEVTEEIIDSLIEESDGTQNDGTENGVTENDVTENDGTENDGTENDGTENDN